MKLLANVVRQSQGMVPDEFFRLACIAFFKRLNNVTVVNDRVLNTIDIRNTLQANALQMQEQVLRNVSQRFALAHLDYHAMKFNIGF